MNNKVEKGFLYRVVQEGFCNTIIEQEFESREIGYVDIWGQSILGKVSVEFGVCLICFEDKVVSMLDLRWKEEIGL